MKTILSTWIRAIYIGPFNPKELILSYGVTGYYDPDHEWFMPDTENNEDFLYYARPKEFIYFPQY